MREKKKSVHQNQFDKKNYKRGDLIYSDFKVKFGTI